MFYSIPEKNLFSVLTIANATVKLNVKIIVVIKAINVPLIWSHLTEKPAVISNGELFGDQYVDFYFPSFNQSIFYI